MLKKAQIITLLTIAIFASQSYAQTIGGNIGLVLNIGSGIHRIGGFAQAFAYKNHTQFNTRFATSINHKHWGAANRTPEIQFGLGAVYSYGNPQQLTHKYDLVSNQTMHSKSMAYAINWYFDKNTTSQRTGTLAYQHNEWRYIFENDIFGQFMVDKYRTAAALVSYSYGDIDYSIKMILWTGDFRGKGVKRIKTDTVFKARFGYYDVSMSPHGKESHGILCFQAQSYFNYAQNTKLQIGIDAEQVRNVFQNKFMHDAYFIPAKYLPYKNLHFPMIASDGELYLYKEGQKIRSPKLHFNFATNDNLFY